MPSLAGGTPNHPGRAVLGPVAECRPTCPRPEGPGLAPAHGACCSPLAPLVFPPSLPGRQKANDPDYDLEASLGSAHALRGSPRPKAPKAAELAAELEAQKEQIMEQMKLVREGQSGAARQAAVQPVACAVVQATGRVGGGGGPQKHARVSA